MKTIQRTLQSPPSQLCMGQENHVSQLPSCFQSPHPW
jgi:hypothetical protein